MPCVEDWKSNPLNVVENFFGKWMFGVIYTCIKESKK